MAGSPSRMLKLLSLLQTRRDWPGRVLVERLEISERTLRRDIDHLRELGYQVNALRGPEGGYRLDAGSQLPPLLFDDEQVIALAVALRVAAASGTADAEAALQALTTVRQVLPARLRHRADSVAFTAMLPDGAASAAVDPEVLVAVSAAVRAHEVLRLDYVPVGQDSGDEPVRRRVEPHHVVFRAGRWYLIAWDLERADWRVLRLDRTTPRIPTGPRFTPRTLPGGDVHGFLAARFKGSDRGNAWPCVGEVVLQLPARDVLPFVPAGSVEELAPDRCRLTLGAWSWVALAADVARFDAPVLNVAPRQLAEAFEVIVQRFAGSR